METEQQLISVCLALLQDIPCELSAKEKSFVKEAIGPSALRPSPQLIATTRDAIQRGLDPLGDAFSAIRSPEHRRAAGAIYTPLTIVQSMMRWIVGQAEPGRIVDPGAGSGRFILAAAAIFSKAHLIAIEMDPLAALTLRANLHVRGFSKRTTVLVKDYREVKLEPYPQLTAFIGNPPYVRHHQISEQWKAWYSRHFASFGIKASALAGLHLHFFLQTRLLAKNGDIGAFITSAEWMDVNYGAALRHLLLNELGVIALHVLEPTVEAFPGTATTAAITCFNVGRRAASLRVRAVDELKSLNGLTKGVYVAREKLNAAPRWSVIIRPSKSSSEGEIELGELFRVHRGQVTGANGIWIAGEHALHLPDKVKVPTVTKAKDLIQAGAHLRSAEALRRVIDLPVEFDEFTVKERQSIDSFLSWAKMNGGDRSYIAQHRKTWWSVGLKAPAPILCTYMARRPPQFTINSCAARHINIAHGLYPRESMSEGVLVRLVTWLNKNISTSNGRTYAGGLTKFEPKEIERLRIPTLETLLA
jgi:hypothetical protein